MESRSLQYAAESCQGELVHGDAERLFEQVVTDSRRISRGDLFVALKGERFDGHEFVESALNDGAVGAVVERGWIDRHPSVSSAIAVSNTIEALGRLAACYRREFDIPIIAVAGSNGKTTTKNLLASVLREERRALWSEASFNNNIGVPMTLLKLDSTHQVAALEVGTNHPGELAELLEMIAPQFGALTNIGREHLEFFGDLAGVADEEGALAEQLPVDGILFVNGDSPLMERVIERSRAEVVCVGQGAYNDWRARDLRLDATGCSFVVEAPVANFAGEYRVNLLGRNQATNALLAIAIGAELGISPATVKRGLAECRPAPMRMEASMVSGVTVINDAYNANADSTAAALETLAEIDCDGRRVAVFGDMAELGAQSEAAHAEAGARAANSGVDALFVVGEFAHFTADAAREAGLSEIYKFEDVSALAAALKAELTPGDVVLIKASRASRLERVEQALRTQEQ